LSLQKLAWLAVILALGGCRGLPPAPPPPAITGPEDLLSRLQARQHQVQSFQGKGRIILISPEHHYAGSGLLIGKAPATLRADIYDPLGRSLLGFASDGREVAVLFPQEARFCRGPATPANLAVFIPPAVTLPQALKLLTAAAPLSPGPPDRWDFQTAPGQYLLEWRNRDGTPRERLWVEAQDLNPVKDDWFGDGGPNNFSVEWGDFGRLDPHLPGKVTLRTYHPLAELRLTYSELQVNPVLAAADLTLPPPPGVTVVPFNP
jgi:hypothetical protein